MAAEDIGMVIILEELLDLIWFGSFLYLSSVNLPPQTQCMPRKEGRRGCYGNAGSKACLHAKREEKTNPVMVMEVGLKRD